MATARLPMPRVVTIGVSEIPRLSSTIIPPTATKTILVRLSIGPWMLPIAS
jgi:hypothetical protein